MVVPSNNKPLDIVPFEMEFYESHPESIMDTNEWVRGKVLSMYFLSCQMIRITWSIEAVIRHDFHICIAFFQLKTGHTNFQ